METQDVVVVGAGYAGVHAAYQIMRARPSAKVLVLEADAMPGGRVRSIEIAPGKFLDFGAHYLGVRQTRAVALAHRLAGEHIYKHPPIYGPDPAFRTFVEGSYRITRKSTSFLEIQGLSKSIPYSQQFAMFASLARYYALENEVDVDAPWSSARAAELDARPASSFIADQEGPNWIREMWGIGILDILSVWPEDISLLYWLWYNRANGGFLLTANDFTGGPQELSLSCGLGGLLLRHAEEVTRLGVELRTSARVTHIAHDPNGVHLTLADGTIHNARVAIVAVTPAIAGRIAYEPAVSPERALLHAQATGHASKAIAVYRTAFWREDPAAPLMGFTAGARALGVEWGLDTTHPDGPASFSFFVSDRVLDDAGPKLEARKAAVLASLVEAMGDPRAGTPDRIEIWDWREHPTVAGGPNTSFAPNVLSRVGSVFGRPEGPHNRLLFAAAEYSTVHPGYVDGALASAELAAAQALWRLSSVDRPIGQAPTFGEVLGRCGRPGPTRAYPPIGQAFSCAGDALLVGERLASRIEHCLGAKLGKPAGGA